MNRGMQDDFKRDGMVSQIIKRITDLEAFEREMRLKQFGASGSGGFSLIEQQAGVASFDFLAIPGTYRILKLFLIARSDRAANSDKINLKINNDATAGNYNSFIQALYQGGPSSEEFLGTLSPVPVAYATGATSPADTYAEYEFTFPYYSSVSIRKDWQARGGGRFDTPSGTLQMFDGIGNYESTTDITRLTLTVNLGTTFTGESVAALYGIT